MVNLPIEPRGGSCGPPEDDALTPPVVFGRYHSAVAMWLFATAWMAWAVPADVPRRSLGRVLLGWGVHHGLGACGAVRSRGDLPGERSCARAVALAAARPEVCGKGRIGLGGDREAGRRRDAWTGILLAARCRPASVSSTRSGHLAPPRGAGAPAGGRRARRRNVSATIHSFATRGGMQAGKGPRWRPAPDLRRAGECERNCGE